MSANYRSLNISASWVLILELSIQQRRKYLKEITQLLNIFEWTLKPRLKDQTFSSNIVFVAQNAGWLNEQTMFDQTSSKVSPHNAFCVLSLMFLIGCFFLLGLALEISNICLWSKMLDENVWFRSNMGSHSNAMAKKQWNKLVEHDVGWKVLDTMLSESRAIKR